MSQGRSPTTARDPAVTTAAEPQESDRASPASPNTTVKHSDRRVLARATDAHRLGHDALVTGAVRDRDQHPRSDLIGPALQLLQRLARGDETQPDGAAPLLDHRAGAREDDRLGT